MTDRPYLAGPSARKKVFFFFFFFFFFFIYIYFFPVALRPKITTLVKLDTSRNLLTGYVYNIGLI